MVMGGIRKVVDAHSLDELKNEETRILESIDLLNRLKNVLKVEELTLVAKLRERAIAGTLQPEETPTAAPATDCHHHTASPLSAGNGTDSKTVGFPGDTRTLSVNMSTEAILQQLDLNPLSHLEDPDIEEDEDDDEDDGDE